MSAAVQRKASSYKKGEVPPQCFAVGTAVTVEGVATPAHQGLNSKKGVIQGYGDTKAGVGMKVNVEGSKDKIVLDPLNVVPVGLLPKGLDVVAHSLKSADRLNNQPGTIKGYWPDKTGAMMVNVQFYTEADAVNLRPANVRPRYADKKVEIHGLEKQPALNGALGTVVGNMAIAAQGVFAYRVELSSGEAKGSVPILRAKNLREPTPPDLLPALDIGEIHGMQALSGKEGTIIAHVKGDDGSYKYQMSIADDTGARKVCTCLQQIFPYLRHTHRPSSSPPAT